MRRPFSCLTLILLAWCIGFQPIALAMGVRCTHGDGSPAPVAAMADDAHAMHAMGGHEGHSGHAQDVVGTQDASGASKAGAPACDCGCDCALPGCLGSAPAMGPTSSGPLVSASGTIRPAPESRSRLRAAHGLDLIRPPSKS